MRILRFLASSLVHLSLLLISVDRLILLSQLPAPELASIFNPAVPTHGFAKALFSSMPDFVRPDTVARQKAWWSIAIALVLISWILHLISMQIRPRPLRVKTPEGDSLLLDPGAIINFTKAQIDAHPAVTRHRVQVRQFGGRSVAITARVKVVPMQSLPEIRRELESSIRDGFSQVLGIEKIDNITIIMGLDEKNIGRRPGPPGKAEPPVPVPPRAALEPAPEPEETRDFTYEPVRVPDDLPEEKKI